MRDEHKSQIVTLLVAVLSFVLHGGAWAGLGMLPPIDVMLAELRAFEVEIVSEPPEPEPPPPEPEPETPPEPEPPPPEPEPEPVRERRPEPVAVPDPPPAPTPEPPPIEERIEDFTGETLTNPDGESWTTVLGNGAPMEGPIGAASGTTTGRSRAGEAGGAIGGGGTGSDEGEPALVALADLSRPPTVPAGLSDSLLRFYPAELRARGVEGTATVRMRLLPGGRLTRFRLQAESQDGFGQACIDMLEESSGTWEEVHDRAGNVVSTTVSFTCRFSLRF